MTNKQVRPPYEIVLMHDHILRLEEELEAKNKYEVFLRWLLKQQYYIIHPNIRKKIKELLESEE